MGTSAEWLAWVAVLAGLALAAFALHRRGCRRRVRRVEGRVNDYLSPRYGGKAPGGLHVDCSDDPLWPVLVSFDDPRGGPRVRLRFSCPGAGGTVSLIPGQAARHGAAPATGA
jgi:hypothetical protein